MMKVLLGVLERPPRSNRYCERNEGRGSIIYLIYPCGMLADPLDEGSQSFHRDAPLGNNHVKRIIPLEEGERPGHDPLSPGS